MSANDILCGPIYKNISDSNYYGKLLYGTNVLRFLLSSDIDSKKLDTYLDDTNNYEDFEVLINTKFAVRLMLRGKIRDAILNSEKALKIILNSFYVENILSYDKIVEKIITTPNAFNELKRSYIAMNIIANSIYLLKLFDAYNVFPVFFTDPVSIECLVNSKIAMNYIVNSYGLVELFNEYSNFVHECCKSPIAIESIVNSENAMNLIAESEEILDIVLTYGMFVQSLIRSIVGFKIMMESEIGVQKLVNSGIAMNIIKDSEEVMNLFVKSPMIMKAIYKSEVATDAVFSSPVSRLAIQNSDVALTALQYDMTCIQRLIDNSIAVYAETTNDSYTFTLRKVILLRRWYDQTSERDSLGQRRVKLSNEPFDSIIAHDGAYVLTGYSYITMPGSYTRIPTQCTMNGAEANFVAACNGLRRFANYARSKLMVYYIPVDYFVEPDSYPE